MLAPAGAAKASVTNVCEAAAAKPGREIAEEEADVPEGVLDVVAEDPEEEHVAGDVEPAGVQEHRREDALVPGQVGHQDAGWTQGPSRVHG